LFADSEIVDMSVRINADLCSCKKAKKPCTRAVIDSKTKALRVQRFSAEQGLYSWDLAQFRYPQRPDFKNPKIVDKMKWVDLDFPTVAGKQVHYLSLERLC